MNVNRHRKAIGWGIAVLLGVVGALAVPTVQICRDWAFIDVNTGSRKGYREWCLGFHTGHWHCKTALAAYIRANYPGTFSQCWVSYAGTGRNVFGQAILCGHGHPGPITHLQTDLIDAYCRRSSATEMKQLYVIFSSRNPNLIEAAANTIREGSFP